MKRIYHTWDEWECYPAGFYESRPKGRNISDGMCKMLYARFLRDIPRFEAAMSGVLADWPNSTEHYLSHEGMNRVAWLGQAAMCYATGIPAVFCGGYNQLTEAEKAAADVAAWRVLNGWLIGRGEAAVSLRQATLSNTVYIHGLGEGDHEQNTTTHSTDRSRAVG